MLVKLRLMSWPKAFQYFECKHWSTVISRTMLFCCFELTGGVLSTPPPPLYRGGGKNLRVHLRVKTLNILGSLVPVDKVAMLDDNNGVCDFSTANQQQPYFISSTQEQQLSERAHQTLQKYGIHLWTRCSLSKTWQLTVLWKIMHGLVETLLDIYTSLV